MIYVLITLSAILGGCSGYIINMVVQSKGNPGYVFCGGVFVGLTAAFWGFHYWGWLALLLFVTAIPSFYIMKTTVDLAEKMFGKTRTADRTEEQIADDVNVFTALGTIVGIVCAMALTMAADYGVIDIPVFVAATGGALILPILFPGLIMTVLTIIVGILMIAGLILYAIDLIIVRPLARPVDRFGRWLVARI